MFGRIALLIALPLAGCASPASEPPMHTSAQQGFLSACTDWDDWDKPAPPFKVHGDTYYVGTCGISAILIAGEEGHVLIDSGTAAGAEVVLRNIAELGFDAGDIRYLLHSHEHFDHVGGMGVLRAATGAWIIPSEAAEQVLKTGMADAGDPQAAVLPNMAPVEVYQTLSDKGTIVLGTISLTAFETPGHTAGALTWQWDSCEKGQCTTVVYADSLSPVSAHGYRYSDHPELVGKFRRSLDRVAGLKCDILLTPHPSASDMIKRMTAGSLEGGMSCAEYAAALSKRLDDRLAREVAGK